MNLAELRDVFVCRRQIDGLKDTMNASVMAGVEGAVAKRIAGDENREYILQVFFHAAMRPMSLLAKGYAVQDRRGLLHLWSLSHKLF